MMTQQASSEISSSLAPDKKPASEYWRIVVPTFMENWPSDLHNMSIPSRARKLTRDECLVLGASILDWGEAFNISHLSGSQINTVRIGLTEWLDEHISVMPYGAFVRLGSRSPKDGLYWGTQKDDNPHGRVDNGTQAFWRLTAASERIADDLRMQLSVNYPTHIFIRQWIDMPEWCEFRCFQKNGRLIGVSQYYHRGVYSEVCDDAPGLKWAIEQFHQLVFAPTVQDNPELNDVVFDIFITRRGNGDHRYEVKLLEINPYFNLTDPCLFDWNQPADFNGQLKYRFALGPRASCTKEV
jgi:D123